MTTFEQTVVSVTNEVYLKGFQQLTIDFIQEQVEEVLANDQRTSEDIGALCNQCANLLKIMNPVFEKDVDLLTRMHQALRVWWTDVKAINTVLNLPKQK